MGYSCRRPEARAEGGTQGADGARALVANVNSNNIDVIDLGTNTVTNTIPTGPGPHSIAVTPDGQSAWITGRSSFQVWRMDLNTLTIEASLAMPSVPSRIDITPDGQRAFVAIASPARIVAIDLASEMVTALINPPGDAFGMATDGEIALATLPNDDQLTIVDVASNTIAATIPVQDRPTEVVIRMGGGGGGGGGGEPVDLDGTEYLMSFDLTSMIPSPPYESIHWSAVFDVSDPVTGGDVILTRIYGGLGGTDFIIEADHTSFIQSGGTILPEIQTVSAIYNPMEDGTFSFGLRMQSGTATLVSLTACGKKSGQSPAPCVTYPGG